MLHNLHRMLAPAVMERLTLLLNHVLGSEAVATQRLLPHAGKTLQIEAAGWPALLPPLPALVWQVTPAGLLEWCGDAVPEAREAQEPKESGERQAPPQPAPIELQLRVAADNPMRFAARLAAGEMPAVEIAGDAAFAADVNWLLQNLRWDLAGDLERVLPLPLVAALARAGSGFKRALATAMQGLGTLRERWPGRPGG
ncbi:MAG TPA: hypothetical protein PKO45_06835 [Rubrivivax sp.]|nr:hypothetical protein [Burkholderiales bacterium]HNT38821.1 hypothetical protein [Rubrivivax sp.]